jgi:glycyl-tRNA synthetase
MKKEQNKMEKIVAFLKDNGFINLSSEPYGGFSSSYDYGVYGVEIKNNLKQA